MDWNFLTNTSSILIRISRPWKESSDVNHQCHKTNNQMYNVLTVPCSSLFCLIHSTRFKRSYGKWSKKNGKSHYATRRMEKLPGSFLTIKAYCTNNYPYAWGEGQIRGEREFWRLLALFKKEKAHLHPPPSSQARKDPFSTTGGHP